jgi:hypothetical protein
MRSPQHGLIDELTETLRKSDKEHNIAGRIPWRGSADDNE